ncbi:phosphate ABC transporter ATP-binding protein [Gracilimonas sp.]|uniref:phosphate ABC transporter ATP-binding protein n=1 Tax=Gracilimonas sp. TaxID=1974203 RepID=UPI003BA912AF
MKNKAEALKIISTREEAEVNCFSVENFSAWIGDSLILKDIKLTVQSNTVHCLIGPSGAGKSTLIRCFNRICDETEGFSTQGTIAMEGKDVFSLDANELRRSVGMVFQKPAVFPKSIKENVLLGVSYHRKLSRLEQLNLLEEKLRAVSLWDEVSHRLDESATKLSTGQQQRLCLARTLAVDPKVILLDEPTSSLDPVSSKAIEELMLKMKEDYTIIFVTHNIQQAYRIADNVTFMCEGKVIETGNKADLFAEPKSNQTRHYLGEEYCDC